MNWIRFSFTTTLIAISFGNLQAQTASATLSGSDTVKQGEVLQLIFRFENVDANDFELPDLVGLTPVGSPSSQSSMTFMNGKRTSTKALVYRVVAEQTGLAYVPEVSVMHDDKEIKTEALKVFVTEDPGYVPMQEGGQQQGPALEPKKKKRPIVKM